MFPSKDCKNFIYTLLHDNLLTITELSKTADHAPSRTTYLFGIDYNALVRKLLENSYKVSKQCID
jgi:DNA-directed RNA polymerase III subunit RPC3